MQTKCLFQSRDYGARSWICTLTSPVRFLLNWKSGFTPGNASGGSIFSVDKKWTKNLAQLFDPLDQACPAIKGSTQGLHPHPLICQTARSILDYFRGLFSLSQATFYKTIISYDSSILFYIILLLCCCPFLHIEAQVDKRGFIIKKISITSEEGDKMKLESGMLTVLENRDVPGGHKISIAFRRLKSKNKTQRSAIFMLAGGPGASWINSMEKQERFQEVQFYSQFADVVVFDQRGAGQSIPNLKCKGRYELPEDQPLTLEAKGNAMRKMATDCKDYWEAQGVDIAAYTTAESVHDINELRLALGYDKIILIGGSYGSHLGLHMMRTYPDVVDRAIFYGLEGPDHTWDVPGEKLNALKRIAAIAEKSPYYQNQIPESGLIGALEEVLHRMDNGPIIVDIEEEGQQFKVEIDKWIIQAIATYKAGKRNAPLAWPDMILAMYNEDYYLPTQVALSMRSTGAPSAMSNAMDFASGISEARRKQIDDDPAKTLLGDINFPYTASQNIWSVNDLGEDFRENVKTDHPVLLIHGTWDLSTPLENALEVHQHLKNSQLIKVIGGTHGALYNLYENWPAIFYLLEGFIKGELVAFPEEVTLPAIEFPSAVDPVQLKFWNAAISGNAKVLEAAIEEGADINALDTRTSKTGRRALNWAAWHGHSEIIALLLAHGVDINAQNKSGFTAIHHAAENCQAESFKVLMDHGADLDIKNKRGKSVAFTAKQQACDQIRLLIMGTNKQ